MEVIRAAHVGSVAALPRGRHLLCLSFGPNGDVVGLSSDKPAPWREVQHGRSNEEPFHYQVHRLDHTGLMSLDLDPTQGASTIAGSHAFAVWDTKALFAGGYQHRGRLFVVPLDTMVPEEVQASDSAGVPVEWQAAFARRSSLFLRAQEDVFRIDLRTR